MAFTAYIMDNSGVWRLETVKSEEVAPPKGNDLDEEQTDLDEYDIDYLYWQNPID